MPDTHRWTLLEIAAAASRQRPARHDASVAWAFVRRRLCRALSVRVALPPHAGRRPSRPRRCRPGSLPGPTPAARNFRGESTVRTWLFESCATWPQISDGRRCEEAPGPQALDEDVPSSGPGPLDRMQELQAAAFVGDFVARLDADRRDLFGWCCWKKFPCPKRQPRSEFAQHRLHAHPPASRRVR